MEKKRLSIFFVIFLAVIFTAYLEKSGYFVKKEVAVVARVIDGDTLELDNGRKVRLLGINTPERDEFYFQEAKDELKKLVEGKRVLLERDTRAIDKYGRLLRHVYLDDIFVNLHMVESGYGNAYIVKPNFKYSSKFFEAESRAIKAGAGIWKSENSPYSNCIKLVELNYLENEYVVFKNFCNFSIDITDWKVKDAERNVYIFPKLILNAGDSITLNSDFGVNVGNILFWNRTNIWTDYGDILILRDSNENLILAQRYS